ncbi:MAG: methionine adenosyltransferase domain-containing protein [Hyphomonas sp.]
MSIYVDTHDTGNADESRIAAAIRELFDLKPSTIRSKLDRRRPIYGPSAAYGHFGRPRRGRHVQLGKTDLASELARLVNQDGKPWPSPGRSDANTMPLFRAMSRMNFGCVPSTTFLRLRFNGTLDKLTSWKRRGQPAGQRTPLRGMIMRLTWTPWIMVAARPLCLAASRHLMQTR